jgi:hypothetical protein
LEGEGVTVDELRRELLLERFGPVPWAERHRRPLPLKPAEPRRWPAPVTRVTDPAVVVAARRIVLLLSGRAA